MYIDDYLKVLAKENECKSKFEGMDCSLHISAEEIISILGEDMFTLQDLYSAERFWINLCSYDDTKKSRECLDAQKRWQDNHCTDKLAFCDKNDRRVEVEAFCSTAKGMKRRISTVSEEQEKKYELCCYLNWDFSMDYDWEKEYKF